MKPTTEELILKELKAIRKLLEAESVSASTNTTNDFQSHSDGSPLKEDDYDPVRKVYVTH